MVPSDSTEPLSSEPLSTEPLADEPFEYQAPEPWAILAVVLALASPLALLAPVLWLVPALALLAALVALARLRSEPGRAGRTAALVALGVAAFFLVAPAARDAANLVLLPPQARAVGDQFLAYLRQRSPEKAVLMRFIPDARPAPDAGLWLHFRADDEARAELLKLAADPLIRTLLALGNRADLRFYRTNSVAAEGGLAQVDLWYTVTYEDDDGRKKTFLVGLLVERNTKFDTPRMAAWRVRAFTFVSPLAGETPQTG